jgi:hypothetical protein
MAGSIAQHRRQIDVMIQSVVNIETAYAKALRPTTRVAEAQGTGKHSGPAASCSTPSGRT